MRPGKSLAGIEVIIAGAGGRWPIPRDVCQDTLPVIEREVESKLLGLDSAAVHRPPSGVPVATDGHWETSGAAHLRLTGSLHPGHFRHPGSVKALEDFRTTQAVSVNGSERCSLHSTRRPSPPTLSSWREVVVSRRVKFTFIRVTAVLD